MPVIKTEVTKLKETKNGPVEITVEESLNYYWGIPLEKLLRSMLFSIYFKQEEAGDKTREFFSQFFRVNPSIAHAVKGIFE